MRLFGILVSAVVLLGAAEAAAQSTASAGYDPQGRLSCVQRQVAGGTRTTSYPYDAAGNRTSVATATNGTCSSTDGTPPTPPSGGAGAITVTNPAYSLSSGATDTRGASALGSTTISGGSLAVVGALTQGSSGSCGSASVSSGSVVYTAPTLSSGGSPVVCRVSYALRHTPSQAQRTGEITYTISPPGGGGGAPDDPPGGECPPGNEICI